MTINIKNKTDAYQYFYYDGGLIELFKPHEEKKSEYSPRSSFTQENFEVSEINEQQEQKLNKKHETEVKK
jgi:hypothetical protein